LERESREERENEAERDATDNRVTESCIEYETGKKFEKENGGGRQGEEEGGGGGQRGERDL